MIGRCVRQKGRWFVVVSILLAFATIHSAPVADAHAILESSSPADQSVSATSPDRVTLSFSEPVTLVTESLRVFDANGSRVDRGVASHAGAGSRISIALKSPLATGSYAVAWRVISADTHPVHGGFVFSVGRSGTIGGLNSYLTQSSQPTWTVAGGVLRAIAYLGSFLLAGAAVFVTFIRRRREMLPGLVGVATAVAVVTVAAQILQLPVSAALATGEGPGSVFSSGTLGELLGQGTVVTIVGVAFGVVAALVALLEADRIVARRFLAGLSVAAVTVGFVASGHTRSTNPAWLVAGLDAIHVAAATLWVGGVLTLAWSLRTARRADPPEDPVTSAAEVVGFSRVATVSIFAVAAAGIGLALVEIGSIRALTSTLYGRLVLVKVGLLLLLALLGGFNHFRLVPAVVARPNRPARWGYLRRTLRAEAVALVAILGVTSALVNAVPARTAVESNAVYAETAPLGRGTVNLVIDPARTGPTALHLYLLDAQGRTNDNVRTVAVALVQPKLDIGPVTYRLRRGGPGHFLINGTLFTVAGDWQVTMRVRADEFTEDTAVLTVKIAP